MSTRPVATRSPAVQTVTKTCTAYTRPEAVVREEYAALLEHSVRLRFRADVPVGINLSGGLDSSMLLGLVHRVQGADSDVKVFTFVTGDPAYDELEGARDTAAHFGARVRVPSQYLRSQPRQYSDLFETGE